MRAVAGGLNELHEWRKLHAAYPQRVEALVAGHSHLTREQAGLLRTQLEQETSVHEKFTPAPVAHERVVQVPPLPQPPEPKVTAAPPPRPEPDTPPRPESQPSVSGKARVATKPAPIPSLLASLDGERVRILTHVIPDAEGHVCAQSINTDTPHQAVQTSRLTLIGLGLK